MKRIALAAAIGLALLSSVVYAVEALGAHTATAVQQAASEPSDVTRILAVVAAVAFMAWRRRRD